MSPISYQFDRAQWDSFKSSRDFSIALKNTGKFYRAVDSKILFLLPNNEFVGLCRKQELQSVLEDGDCPFFKIDHPRHELSADDWAGFWYALSDNRWRLPSASNRPSVSSSRTAVRA